MKAVIFDLDGTIFNLNVDWNSLKRTLHGLGWQKESLGKQIGAVVSSGSADIELVTKAELQGVEKGSTVLDIFHVMSDMTKSYKLAIVTRNSNLAASAALKKIGTMDVIVVGREDVQLLKPHPEGVQLAISKLAVDKNDTIMVGDTYHDVEAAHLADIKCIIVKNPDLKYQPEGADYYIEKISQLPSLIRSIK